MRRTTLLIATLVGLAAGCPPASSRPAAPVEPGRAVAIPAIQGRGSASPLVGERVTTRGVVTLVLPRGFFLQDPLGDGDPRTSDGLFVFTGWPPRTVAGDAVQVTGQVTEFANGGGARGREATGTLTELTSVHVVRTGAGAQVAAVPLGMPLDEGADMEALEGMKVELRGPLAVLEPPRSERGGAFTASCGPRLHAPTDQVRPGAEALRIAARNARCRVLVELAAAPRGAAVPALAGLRTGAPLGNLSGVVGDTPAPGARAASVARIHPLVSWAPPVAPARASHPPEVGGDLRVASVNVQNFFVTLNDGHTPCFPGSPRDCRGARTPDEFVRQRDKIVEALVRLDADVVGLMEIENNPLALDTLVAALNARSGGPRYAAVREPASPSAASAVRGDAIQVALIYRAARVRPAGEALRDRHPVHDRPPLAQAFRTPSGTTFTVIVSHFKSKRCQNARGADADQGDLQGCFNARRVRQAQALKRFAGVAAPTGALLIGDLNAHAEEDPLHELRSGGFIDVLAKFRAPGQGLPYTYVFDGVAGRLDHMLASPSLVQRFTGAAVWHINADEPVGAGGPGDPVRSSDHDPVLAGLALGR